MATDGWSSSSPQTQAAAGLGLYEATDIVFVVLSPDLYRELVVD